MPELFDNHNRRIDYLRVSITDKCNLRCIYCMPKEGLSDFKKHRDILTYEEIELFVSHAIKQGISKVRLTGGEPLVRRDVVDLIRSLSGIPELHDMSLTTNGVLLADFAEELYKAGLERINVSIDSLNSEKFKQITRVGDLNIVKKGIQKALDVGFKPLKINAVILKGINDGLSDLKDFAKLTFDYPLHVRFIEYMPFSKEVGFKAGLTCSEIAEKLKTFGSLNKVDSPRGSGPARYMKFKGALGTVGFISPMSNHFCPECNRLRLTADGKLKTCLFSNDEIDIIGPMRNNHPEEAVKEVLSRALKEKPKDHSSALKKDFVRTMSQIGG
ncbi:GTP 3',8-cyclase MoaA [Candidatus Oleimmundimicrobium sp.]|uniref:GTP 3',8-cyclase MoaA n=1 Tax=Candidatus Oleimmundimicrobium sp. TaxID=3060597 RepID=UPI002720677E|nr:GTP 3',8-cyclase MoaA [Candidatus Oleimmundimicrobium sp.]MDO8886885.1 GTP 3',8-cyclase MoaA [Candidatus Oleimmundimicrobium sp.]